MRRLPVNLDTLFKLARLEARRVTGCQPAYNNEQEGDDSELNYCRSTPCKMKWPKAHPNTAVENLVEKIQHSPAKNRN